MYEVSEYCEATRAVGDPHAEAVIRILGTFESEVEAIEVARSAWTLGRELDTTDVMWWVVKAPGEQLCRWIADRSSSEEQILDLTTGTLVVVR